MGSGLAAEPVIGPAHRVRPPAGPKTDAGWTRAPE